MHRIDEQNRWIGRILATDQDDAIKIDHISRIRRWFGAPSDTDTDTTFHTIKAYMSEQLTLLQASDVLFFPIDVKIIASELDDVNVRITALWSAILHTARRTPFQHTTQHAHLLALVQAFKSHEIPSPLPSTDLYAKLPFFTLACREAYNDAPVPGLSFPLEAAAWANLNYFYALLTGKRVVDLATYFAIWAMRAALEHAYTDGEGATAAQKYDAHVPAAAAWVGGAFRELYGLDVDLSPEEEGQGDPARGGELWKGRSGFSRERWGVWKERFAEVGGMKGLGEGTRGVAKDAVEAMERAETFEMVV